MKTTPYIGGRTAPLFILLLNLVFSTGLIAADTPNPDLSGVVKTASGNPLPGARVFIYTAGPKEGVGVLCPSCYPDCGKRATSDKDGKFKINSLNPSLFFRVLIVGSGHQPTFVPGIDPAKGPIETTLKAVSKAETPDRQVRGRVMDMAGDPLAGAVVEIRGVTRGTSTRFGGNPDVDPLAVTDENGRFVIHSENPFDAVGVEVTARGFAKGIFQKLSALLHKS